MTSNTDLEANKAFKNRNSLPTCRYCNKKGHLEANCYSKHPELRQNNRWSNKTNKNPNTSNSNNQPKEEQNKSNKVIISAFKPLALNSNTTISSNNTTNKYKFVLDSGASEHYTSNKEWLINYRIVQNRSITIANSSKVAILGISNIPIIYKDYNILLKDVYYIPSLQTTLINSKELTNKN